MSRCVSCGTWWCAVAILAFLEGIQYILENEMFDSWQMVEGSRLGDSQWLVTNYGFKKTVVKMWIYVLNKTYTYINIKKMYIYIIYIYPTVLGWQATYWFTDDWNQALQRFFHVSGSNLRMTLKHLKKWWHPGPQKEHVVIGNCPNFETSTPLNSETPRFFKCSFHGRAILSFLAP